MNERHIEERLSLLIERLRALPDEQRRPLEELCEEGRDQRSRVEESVAQLQDSLDYLRLSVKYLVFDLEATRRENIYLRKLVEQIRRDGSPRRDNDDNFYGNGAD